MTRPSAASRGYDSKWRVAREAYLKAHPLCAYCLIRGKEVQATRVDHKLPHRGDRKLFWKRSNWRGLCQPCHDGAKQKEERTGRVIGCDESGHPLDPNHHWGVGVPPSGPGGS